MAILDTSAFPPDPEDIVSVTPVAGVGTQGKSAPNIVKGQGPRPRSKFSTNLGLNDTWKEAFSAYTKRHPKLYEAIYGRRFLLPKYRTDDYSPQDLLNNTLAEQLFSMLLGIFGYRDDVHNAACGNYFLALCYNRPILFLERELGEALLRTRLLVDMETSDIHWRWPSVRIVLPAGLLTLEREGVPRNALYVDIGLIPTDGAGIPKAYATEFEANVEYSPFRAAPGRMDTHKWRVCMGEPFLSVSTMVDYSEFGFGPTVYAYTAPWNNSKMEKLTSYSGNMNAPLACDKTDNEFLERLKLLAINILLFLAATKYEYAHTVVRKVKYEGKHLKPELANAKFVGESQLKAVIVRSESPSEGLSGRTVSSHWRCGHWTRQVYGPKRGQRKIIWIQPCQIHPPLEEVK